jgi:hypothetical protein
MSHQITETQAFVELSDEQQESLAGGYDFGSLDGAFGASLTQFKAKQSSLETISSSGPNGSTAGGRGMTTEIMTGGFNLIKLG